jgi:enamine deaminase RidA (YjgF/YER057c/UK114 family)
VVERINLSGIAPPRRWVYAVRTEGAPLVFLSGMVAERMDGSVPDGLEAQTAQVYENLRIALTELGLEREWVVKETVYIVRWDPSMRAAVGPARDAFWGDHLPASTLAGVYSLGRAEYLIEVEVTVAETPHG